MVACICSAAGICARSVSALRCRETCSPSIHPSASTMPMMFLIRPISRRSGTCQTRSCKTRCQRCGQSHPPKARDPQDLPPWVWYREIDPWRKCPVLHRRSSQGSAIVARHRWTRRTIFFRRERLASPGNRRRNGMRRTVRPKCSPLIPLALRIPPATIHGLGWRICRQVRGARQAHRCFLCGLKRIWRASPTRPRERTSSGTKRLSHRCLRKYTKRRHDRGIRSLHNSARQLGPASKCWGIARQPRGTASRA